LTGTDPDRMPEEKARGMTIDLGFAFFRTASGEEIALVDVPGHERFVKNMIAGAGGIDSVMLVVAADDGWMPQSEEHFQITRLLGVRHGLIVINKCDLAEPEWLELLEQELREKTAGSFLRDAPLFRVSAQTGSGFDRLGEYLNDLPRQLPSRKNLGKARLAVDRSFVRPGMGGVVTGTLRGGNLHVGQVVGVWPAMVTGKVRTLQSAGQEVQIAAPGQRTAVSFTGIEREQLVRGCVISDRTDLTYFRDNPLLVLSVELLARAPVPVIDRRRVLLIVGTTEAEGEVRLLDRKALKPSETGLVYFKPDEPVYALVGDRFVLRLPTPMVTLGGGTVLDHLAALPRRRDLERYAYLDKRLLFTLESLVLSELEKQVLVLRGDLLEKADFADSDIDQTLAQLETDGRISRFDSYLYAVDALKRVADSVLAMVRQKLLEQPHVKGLSNSQLTQALPHLSDVLPVLLDYLVRESLLERKDDLFDLAGRGMSLKGVIKEAHDEILSILLSQKLDPPQLTLLAAKGKHYQQAIKYIIESGEGYKCGSDFLFLSEVWSDIVAFVRSHLRENERLQVADLRDRFGFTRKFAIPILEELDRLSITTRDGDSRMKGKHFEDKSSVS
ncbi:MAG: selenocysteine-specific translation elongation factor, partial [candidate division Zixibacteria bacterium]|nr:selenocysteine-specific translation elongation factor [candidate division Zixibacteria bacterium]